MEVYLRSRRSEKKRLLYGSDWHVLKRLKCFKTFKDRYVEILQHGDFFNDEEIDDFLGGNALTFLGLLPEGKNRYRLEKFYNRHNIAEPKWFKVTSYLFQTSEVFGNFGSLFKIVLEFLFQDIISSTLLNLRGLVKFSL